MEVSGHSASLPRNFGKLGSAQNTLNKSLGGPQTPGKVTAITSAAAGSKTPISQHVASQFTELHRLFIQAHKNKKACNEESLSTDIKYDKNGYRTSSPSLFITGRCTAWPG